jgi:hypothetical protein
MDRRKFFTHAATMSLPFTALYSWGAYLGPLYENSTQTAHPEIIADCSANPFDVRPFVQTIMNSANFILERLPPDIPLVIVMGEHHDRPSHIYSRMALLQQLKVQRNRNPDIRFAYGIEDNLAKYSKLIGKKIVDKKVAMMVQDQGFLLSAETPVSNQAKANFLLRNGINFSFNDIASTQSENSRNSIIDQSDPITRELIAKHAPHQLGKTIYRSGTVRKDNSLGLALSNRMIVQKATQHIKDTSAIIYVQHCGLGHALGHRNVENIFKSDNAYDTSLTALFTDAGFAVLTVCPDHINSPEESVVAMPSTILAQGLDQTNTKDADEVEILSELQRNSRFRFII